EFPELQGRMGGYYALNDGLSPAVAKAISEHYSPRGPNDQCPRAPLSIVVSLADKLDTLVGFFVLREKPTGSRDPYALRRAAIGVIRIVLENEIRLPLLEAIEHSAGLLSQQDPTIEDEIKSFGELEDGPQDFGLLEFFADRLKVHLRERGVRHDLI